MLKTTLAPGLDITSVITISSGSMRQLLLRVPEDLHRRIAARAAREGKSMNAVASAILDATADADTGDRRERLRARAAALGMLNEVEARPVSNRDRERILSSTRGLGQVVDRILDEDRDRAL
jgi:plasmid stability protein